MNGLATWLGRNCDLRVKVAEGGELIRKRTVYIAPDNHHLGVASDHTIQLSTMPAVAGFRPSATWLFESVAKVYGSGVAAVILTGMGNDGVEGLRVVRKAGGRILAQDRESSIVFGMPRDAVAAGVVDTVAALDHIAPWLTSLTSGSTR